MELLDRDTFLEWMERIMTRFDHLKQTRHSPTSDAQRRAAFGQSGGLHDAASQQANLAALPGFGNAPIPYHLPQDVVS
jgi:hypothetical protein